MVCSASFRGQGFGFVMRVSGVRALDLLCEFQGSGLRISGVRLAWGLGFSGSGVGFQLSEKGFHRVYFCGSPKSCPQDP